MNKPSTRAQEVMNIGARAIWMTPEPTVAQIMQTLQIAYDMGFVEGAVAGGREMGKQMMQAMRGAV
jgi:hypothetical protein